jgi:hypothetical protein
MLILLLSGTVHKSKYFINLKNQKIFSNNILFH